MLEQMFGTSIHHICYLQSYTIHTLSSTQFGGSSDTGGRPSIGLSGSDESSAQTPDDGDPPDYSDAQTRGEPARRIRRSTWIVSR